VAAGLDRAMEVGIAFATFGLIAGGVVGGPIAGRLLKKHRLQGFAPASPDGEARLNEDEAPRAATLESILGAILVLAVCIELGALVNRHLFAEGVVLPGFLTSMAVGALITNLADLFRFELKADVFDRAGAVSLSIFLSMSLMSMKLWTLATAALPIVLVLVVQVLVMTFFATYVVFRLMGRDYDAAVISAGFVGLGLGATPVAIANMQAVTEKFGPSQKAFLVVPLVGAFFIDLLNAVTIKAFIGFIGRFYSGS
jgi:ESS family glutamate:Na+ symporter